MSAPDAPPRPLGPREPVAGGIDVDLPGADIRLRGTRWPGSGTPVLLLHGLAAQRHFWDLVVPGLHGVPVLALDQRGHGDSDVPEQGYDGATIATDALTALDAMGWRSVVVVGHSWGAATALRLAADHPDRVAAVVAIDGGFAAPQAALPKEELRALLEPPRLALPPDELREMLTGYLRSWAAPGAAEIQLANFAVGADGLARARLPFDRHMEILDGVLDGDPHRMLAGVRCPAWLVACESVEVLAAARTTEPIRAGWAAAATAGLAAAADTLDRARLFRWAGAVHDVPLQWPALVAGLVRAAVDDALAAGEGVSG